MAVDVPGREDGDGGRPARHAEGPGDRRRHAAPPSEELLRRRSSASSDGAIGEIVYARCYWNGGEIWVIERKPGWSDMEWQLRNWCYFTWLSGDHYRRAARPQPRRHELGARHASDPGRGRRWADARSAPARSTATSSTISPSSSSIPAACACSARPGRSTAATTSSRRPSSAPTAPATARTRSGPSRGRAGASAAANPNPYEQEHEDLIASIRRRQADQRGPGGRREHDDRRSSAARRPTAARRSPGTRPCNRPSGSAPRNTNWATTRSPRSPCRDGIGFRERAARSEAR